MSVDEEPIWTTRRLAPSSWWACPDCREIPDRDGDPAHEGPYVCQHCGKVWA